MEKLIYPCLWFDSQAKEAATFYSSAFENTAIEEENPMVVIFSSAGQKFMCLNGGPQFKSNPSISFFVVCDSETELDNAWRTLLEGGSVLMPLDRYEWSEKYGWVQDKFGVSWQLSLGKMEEVGQKFTPTLMFTEQMHGKAEEAILFYTGIFPNSDIRGILRYTKDDPDETGTVKHAQFSLDKTVFMAMDSGAAHGFGFSEAISLVVECDNQEEIDYYWEQLTTDGQESQCGWLKDKFGVSWQVVPKILGALMKDPARSQSVVQAFLKMKKFDIQTLLDAR